MVWIDIFFLITLFASIKINRLEVINIEKDLKTLDNKNISENINVHLGLFLTCTDIVCILLFIMKILTGLRYLKFNTLPPKIEYTFLYIGRRGLYMWRV